MRFVIGFHIPVSWHPFCFYLLNDWFNRSGSFSLFLEYLHNKSTRWTENNIIICTANKIQKVLFKKYTIHITLMIQ